MRRSLLFLFMLATFSLFGQQGEPVDRFKSSLIISEIRSASGVPTHNYYELSNVGDTAIQLSQFKLGKLRPQRTVPNVWDDSYWGTADIYMFLPEKVLLPGETFLVTNADDYRYEQSYLRTPGFEGFEMGIGEKKIYDMADVIIHESETTGLETDSVTPDAAFRGSRLDLIMEFYNYGRAAVFLEQHLPNGDSIVVDQVFGTFHKAGALNPTTAGEVLPIAGIDGAAQKAVFMRKYSVKTGNLDFFNARGVGLEDSEWIPVIYPPVDNRFREPWWTIGNHGSYELNENTLEPLTDDILVDYNAKTITVPWGIERLDDIMLNMKKKPGVAWYYDLNANREDSLFRSAQTGDKLTISVCGNTLQQATFDILVKDPASGANRVIPIDHQRVSPPGPITNNTQVGLLSWPRVTKHSSGPDTITGSRYGLPYALRVDSLLKYLEKPSNATWEIVWADGVRRPDLMDGDLLQVKAENGDVKAYYLQVRPYEKSDNAYLSSITWPDIPEFYRGFFGWVGDTLPSFASGNFNYNLEIPMDVEGIPALVAKPQSVNATVKVNRAKNLIGSPEDRTISFEVTSEDGMNKNTYSVQLSKEKNPLLVQPYHGEPFFSEYYYYGQNSNVYLEICNPGNQPLDLSKYLIIITNSSSESTPDAAIKKRMNTSRTDWLRRFEKYVPGFKWVDEVEWTMKPGTLKPDPNVNAMVMPGDVFVMTKIDLVKQLSGVLDQWTAPKETDVNFFNLRYSDDFQVLTPWGDEEEMDASATRGNPVKSGRSAHIYLYKILNDSVRQGLKPVNDPSDYQLIDSWGNADYTTWNVAGRKISGDAWGWMRKPGIYHGNPTLGEAFGTNADDSEWQIMGRVYYNETLGLNWTLTYLYSCQDFGKHYFYEPTHYKSTVSSQYFKVSEGYSQSESIRGISAGTKVGEFLNNLIKANENQALKVISSVGGSELGSDALLGMNDKLVVTSADSSNTSIYVLQVTEEGLSSDAILKSAPYQVAIEAYPGSADGEPVAGFGYISGFAYGTQLKTVLNNVTLPENASLSVVNNLGAYVPFKVLNFDTVYVDVTVNPDIYFEVVAEDGKTKIIYQLRPETSVNDAFVLSDVYTVSQIENLIDLVPRGSNVDAFLSNLIPSFGASLELVDKMGNEKKLGTLVEDDKLIVTSASGQKTNVYHISFLPTETLPATLYLAYILSEAYVVDQVNYVIHAGIAPLTSETLLDEFISYITPCAGASVVITDKDGHAKSSGDLNDGDQVKVISADGKIEVIYALDLDLNYSNKLVKSNIVIYPNPSADYLNISGVAPGQFIRLYNADGRALIQVKAGSMLEKLSLNEYPSGLFFIVISDHEQTLGRFKVMKQ